MSFHEEEVLGKAYDAVLMRRLLRYLRPYRRLVGFALAAIISNAGLQLAQPYLMKVAIDQHIATGNLAGLDRIALLFLAILLGSFTLEFLQTWMLQMTGQRIMFDMRMQIYGHLQRLDVGFYDRNPVGRLMTRVTTDVDVLNDLFTAGVVSIFGDVFMLVGIMIVAGRDGLAAGAGRVRRAAADRDGHAVVPAERARVVPHRADADRPDQRLSPGAHHRHVDGAAVPPGSGGPSTASTSSTRSTATPTSSRSSTTPCSTRRSRSSARSRRR